MNTALRKLVAGLDLGQHPGLQMVFCLECVDRVQHLFTAPEVVAMFDEAHQLMRTSTQAGAFEDLAVRAAALARSHPGSEKDSTAPFIGGAPLLTS